MNRKEKIKKELEEISPFLADLKKENPFQVPVNYFDQLSNDILEQVENPEKSVANIPQANSWLDDLLAPIAWLFQPRMALAAIAVLLVAGIFIFRQPAVDPQLATNTGELTEEEANAYIAANIEDFDIDLLTEMALGEPGNDADPAGTILLDDEMIEEILDELDDEDLEDIL